MKEAAAAEAGAMAAVDAPPEQLTALLEGGGVVAANLNSPRQTVISGPREHVEAALEWCRERSLSARLLPVACAFHSPHVAGAQQRLAQLLEREQLAVPGVPVYSNTTGKTHASEPAGIAELLSEHLIRPVEFVTELEEMYRDGARLFVEVGPRSVLTGLVPQTLGDREHLAVSVDRSGRSGVASLLHALAALASEGVPVNTDRLFSGRAHTSGDRDGRDTRIRARVRRLAGRRRPCLARRFLAPTGRAHSRHQSAQGETRDRYKQQRRGATAGGPSRHRPIYSPTARHHPRATSPPRRRPRRTRR